MPAKQIQPDDDYTPAGLIPYDNPEEISTEIISSKCKLCNSQYKDKAEELFEQKKNASLVQRFLDQQGEKISINAVTSHMRNHYQNSKNVSLLKWYDRELANWEELPYYRERSLMRWMTVLTRELHILGSQMDSLSLQERSKQTEQIRKLVETLLNCDGKLHEMKEDIEPVQLIFKQLNVIVQEKLKDSNDPNVKGFIVDVLNQLQEDAGEILLDNE